MAFGSHRQRACFRRTIRPLLASHAVAIPVETIDVRSDDGNGSAYIRWTIAAASRTIYVRCNRHAWPGIVWIASGRSRGNGGLYGRLGCRRCGSGSGLLLARRFLGRCLLTGGFLGGSLLAGRLRSGLFLGSFRCCVLSGLVSSRFRGRSRVRYLF